MESRYLCFIRFIGKDVEGLNNYEFLFTTMPDEFWGENFEYMPCCLCNELIPDENMYDLVKKIRTDIDLDLIQKSCCFSFQDCIDGIVALGWQSLTNLETYPEDGRLILDYGMEYDEVVDVLTNKNIVFED
jgi:hypothetical protein